MASCFFYFDLGNVLVGFSAAKACEQIANLLDRSAREIETILFDNGLQRRYETGLITSSEFAQAVCKDGSVAEAAIILAGSDIFWPLQDSLDWIQRFKQAGIPIGILSNTCQGHWDFLAQGIMEPYLSEFDQIVLSYEVQSMKPSPGIYAEAIRKTNLPPEQILFVDDRAENIEAAQRAGIQAMQFVDEKTIPELLDNCGIQLPP
ncbi:MAG: HAD family phosphatase [Pirellulaceae bacterium]